jgi:hypothetical protein
MKHRCLATACLLLVAACLCAQPHVLPDVDLASESSVRAPLIKRALFFPTEAKRDTIPPSLPQGLPRLLEQRRVVRKGKKAELTASLDTELDLNLQASIYPDLAKLPHLWIGSATNLPGRSRLAQSLKINATTNFVERIPILPTLVFQHSKSKSLERNLFSVELSGGLDSLKAGSVAFSNVRQSIGLQTTGQETESKGLGSTYPLLSNQHTLLWAGHHFDNSLIWQSGYVGTSVIWSYQGQADQNASLRRPAILERLQAMAWLKDVRLGLMTDYVHVLPAFGYSRRFLLGSNQYLNVANSPDLRGWSSSELGLDLPYAALAAKQRISLVPLKLEIAYHNLPSLSLIRSFTLSHTLAYTYNQPVLVMRQYARTPEITSQDFFCNTSSAQVRLIWRMFELEQGFDLVMEHRDAAPYRRRPYSALIRIDSSAKTKYHGFLLSARLSQNYFARDELGNDLPEVFDLGFKAEYKLNSGIRLYAAVNNIFNTPHRLYSNLPAQGRSLEAGVSYTVR